MWEDNKHRVMEESHLEREKVKEKQLGLLELKNKTETEISVLKIGISMNEEKMQNLAIEIKADMSRVDLSSSTADFEASKNIAEKEKVLQEIKNKRDADNDMLKKTIERKSIVESELKNINEAINEIDRKQEKRIAECAENYDKMLTEIKKSDKTEFKNYSDLIQSKHLKPKDYVEKKAQKILQIQPNAISADNKLGVVAKTGIVGEVEKINYSN